LLANAVKHYVSAVPKPRGQTMPSLIQTVPIEEHFSISRIYRHVGSSRGMIGMKVGGLKEVLCRGWLSERCPPLGSGTGNAPWRDSCLELGTRDFDEWGSCRRTQHGCGG